MRCLLPVPDLKTWQPRQLQQTENKESDAPSDQLLLCFYGRRIKLNFFLCFCHSVSFVALAELTLAADLNKAVCHWTSKPLINILLAIHLYTTCIGDFFFCWLADWLTGWLANGKSSTAQLFAAQGIHQLGREFSALIYIVVILSSRSVIICLPMELHSFWW